VVAELEKELIVKASDQSGWNQSKTARLLNMKRDKLRYRMKNFKISDEEVHTS
jgi:transcriptional regulator with GAF, ATPase, and Fis domain